MRSLFSCKYVAPHIGPEGKQFKAHGLARRLHPLVELERFFVSLIGILGVDLRSVRGAGGGVGVGNLGLFVAGLRG